MNPQYDNRTMTPPEDKPSKSELDQDGFEQSALKYVQALYKVDEVYDLYEHDREVAKNFHEWYDKSGWMPANFLRGYEKEVGYINTGPNMPEKITFDELWDIFCNVGNAVHGTENENQ